MSKVFFFKLSANIMFIFAEILREDLTLLKMLIPISAERSGIADLRRLVSDTLAYGSVPNVLSSSLHLVISFKIKTVYMKFLTTLM